MTNAAAVALRWGGRALVLFAPYVILCSLFLPSGVQMLNPVVCPEGMELSNRPYRSPRAPEGGLEVSCVGPDSSESAVTGVITVVVTSLVIGLAMIYVSQRLAHPRYRVPTGPGMG